MTEFRPIQNFVGYKALIVTEAASAVVQLEASLTKLGLAVVYPAIDSGSLRLGEELLTGEQTILFIDADMNVAVETAGEDGALQMPVIGLIGAEAPSRLKSILRLGATATLRKPVYGGSVYSALFMGVNGFRQRRALIVQLQEQERRRHGRRLVMKAVVSVMQAANCDEDAAYNRLRREAMRQRISIEEYCEGFMRALPGAHEGSSDEQGMTSAEKTKQGGTQ